MLSQIILKTAPSGIRHLLSLPKILWLPSAVTILLVLAFHLYFLDKTYPGVSVSKVDLSGKNFEEAQQELAKISPPEQIELKTEDKTYILNDLKITYNYSKSANMALKQGREENLFLNMQNIWDSTTSGTNLPLVFDLDTTKLDQALDRISKDIIIPSSDPEITIQKGVVILNPGKNGQEVELEKLKGEIYFNLAFNKAQTLEIPIKKLNPGLVDEEVLSLKEKAQKLVGKQLKLTFEFESFIYKDSDIFSLMHPLNSQFLPIDKKINELVSDVSRTVNRPPQNARLVFEEGKVKEFAPAKDGVEIIPGQLAQEISEAIKKLEEVKAQEKEIVISVPVINTFPEVRTEEVNNLGIKELIGRGESSFRGSIPSRVHNILLASTRLNGILIKPQEEFSFNKAVGEISGLTGYQQAFVIKEGKTILDDGGGVCQVSTTFFRAILSSGLPVLERHQHSYRVSYYEQGTKPGIDAAIYQPGIDLKLKNDTPAHILVQTKPDTKNGKLVFEFYGTSDGRTAMISTPRLWDHKPAPPDLYQDDPTLPIGTVKQIEKAVPGVKASFEYKVTRDGETLQSRTFYSNYRAWQAVYLRGTATQ